MTGGLLAWTLRTMIVAFAADGLASVSDLSSAACVVVMLVISGAELSLADWFRRNPAGNLRRVFALVLLRLGQPVLWVLASVGVIA